MKNNIFRLKIPILLLIVSAFTSQYLYNGSSYAQSSQFVVSINETINALSQDVDQYMYQYKITNLSGTVIAEGVTFRIPPRISSYSDSIIGISQYLGPAVWSTVFYLPTGQCSREYQNVIYVWNEIIIYLQFDVQVQQWFIIASPIFDQNNYFYCMFIDLAPADGHFQSVLLESDKSLLISYISTDNYSVKQINIPIPFTDQ